MLKIGIDIGGTNTDGILAEDDNVLVKTKRPTRDNIADSIFEVIQDLLQSANKSAAAVDVVMLGTTHFLNAFLQQKHLSRVAVVRLALPTASFLPGFVDWPVAVKSAVSASYHCLQGGYHIDGTEIRPLDAQALSAVAKDIQASEAEAVAISMPFSFIKHDMELIAKSIIQDINPDLPVSCSHQFSKSGLLERENSAIINACLIRYATDILESIQERFRTMLPKARSYITGNDGTLLNIQQVLTMPVSTFASGPTNSMRGAFILTGIKEAIVVDVGGTSTDVGALMNGFPRKRALYSELCGVRSAFSIPDVLSVALGGGSVVKSTRPVKIGPESVAAHLLTESRCFGGKQLTLTDIFFANGSVSLPNADIKAAAISSETIQSVVQSAQENIATVVDKMKSSKQKMPLIAIGGGAYMVQEKIEGISEVLKPEHYEVANAIGAASGEISGEALQVFDYEKIDRQTALAGLKEKAVAEAVGKGVALSTLETVELQEIPVPYLPGKINRVYLKVVGKLKYAETR